MKFITKEFIYFFIFFLEIANILFPNPYVSLGFDPAAKKAARHILESKPPVAPNVGSPKQLEKSQHHSSLLKRSLKYYSHNFHWLFS